MSAEQKKSLDLNVLVRLFAFSKPYRKTLYFALGFSILLALITPIRPMIIQRSVDVYIKNNLLHGLILICIVQLGVLMLESSLRFWFMYRINWLGQTVVNDIRKAIFSKIIHQDIGWFDRHAIGTLTTRTINDIESMNDVFSEGIISIVADVLTILSIIIVMLFTDWRLTLVCLTAFPILIVATWWFKEETKKSFQRVRNAVAALNAFVQEHLTGMYIVQAFAVEEREMGRFKEINKEHRDANIKGIFAYSVFFPIVEIVLAMSIGLLIWYGAVRVMHGGTSLGVIISFQLYINQLFRPLRMMAEKFNVLQMGMIAGERVFTIMDSAENTNDRDTDNATGLEMFMPEKVKGEVEFKDVHFAYKPDVPVLNGVSFRIPPGKTMAIVGHTGAGKTSVISILNRLYEIGAGQILIDGRDIRDYELDNLRSHIGIVLQDVFLFSGSVADNITLRDPEIPIERVKEVARIIGIHDFIMKLPGDYNFNIMERGNNLSQGQKQLLSFARALLYNPSILILDEATSSVDSESEILIQHAIDTLISGRTSIVIAHRLSTIRKANEIIVMDHGTIIERGTHDELLAQRGDYFELYTAVEEQKAAAVLT